MVALATRREEWSMPYPNNYQGGCSTNCGSGRPMPTDDEVRAFMVEIGLRDPDNSSDVTPPEVRYFQNYKPSHDARKASERAAQERMNEQWRRAGVPPAGGASRPPHESVPRVG